MFEVFQKCIAKKKVNQYLIFKNINNIHSCIAFQTEWTSQGSMNTDNHAATEF